MATTTKQNLSVAAQIILAALVSLSIYLIQDTRTDVKDLMSSVYSLSMSVATMGGNRFTNQDGLEMQKEISKLQWTVQQSPSSDKLNGLERRLRDLERNNGTNR